MGLAEVERRFYAAAGHLTVPAVFTAAEMDAAIADAEAWGETFLAHLAPEQRRWYVDGGVTARTVLRKLDNPHAARPVFRALATDPRLVSLVEEIIGPGVTLSFSQIFFKPPEGGGPKPMHQDNVYFGPDDPERLVTAWVALDTATVDNGCLAFGHGSHRRPLLPHAAPPDEPFNLQVPAEIARGIEMTPAPVPKGGVSFHHGGTLHQSGANRSTRWRRAVAFHYVGDGNAFTNAALPYDEAAFLRVS
ncbi:MAG: phytanoyl-CoA dioxygenase family protein [Alphaproteobacteria bacterium]|nr:phytanoyl-CoA dioxygenase family protein [Alphaproteobacteria bacterium]